MNTRKYSGRQEQGIAKKIKAKVQSNSGATAFRKGDLITSALLIECKTQIREQGSITIKREWIDKLKEERFAMNRDHWALAFNFGGLGNPENFYIIDEASFKQLIKILEEEQTYATDRWNEI